jgi:hypothetical protein
MSSLTVALAILGGLVLAAVIGYNTWLSRRNAPRQPDEMRDEPAPPEPALRSVDGDKEPVLHAHPDELAAQGRH